MRRDRAIKKGDECVLTREYQAPGGTVVKQGATVRVIGTGSAGPLRGWKVNPVGTYVTVVVRDDDLEHPKRGHAT